MTPRPMLGTPGKFQITNDVICCHLLLEFIKHERNFKNLFLSVYKSKMTQKDFFFFFFFSSFVGFLKKSSLKVPFLAKNTGSGQSHTLTLGKLQENIKERTGTRVNKLQFYDMWVI